MVATCLSLLMESDTICFHTQFYGLKVQVNILPYINKVLHRRVLLYIMMLNSSGMSKVVIMFAFKVYAIYNICIRH